MKGLTLPVPAGPITSCAMRPMFGRGDKYFVCAGLGLKRAEAAIMRPHLLLACLVVILAAGLLPASAMRIPLRKMHPDRNLRAEVPQPLTPVTGYFAMDMLIGSQYRTASQSHPVCRQSTANPIGRG